MHHAAFARLFRARRLTNAAIVPDRREEPAQARSFNQNGLIRFDA
jgi:hypothetical protein